MWFLPQIQTEWQNSVYPDQTALTGAAWTGSTLFAKTCQSKNLGPL